MNDRNSEHLKNPNLAQLWPETTVTGCPGGRTEYYTGAGAGQEQGKVFQTLHNLLALLLPEGRSSVQEQEISIIRRNRNHHW